jgi:hypothetical protein
VHTGGDQAGIDLWPMIESRLLVLSQIKGVFCDRFGVVLSQKCRLSVFMVFIDWFNGVTPLSPSEN